MVEQRLLGDSVCNGTAMLAVGTTKMMRMTRLLSLSLTVIGLVAGLAAESRAGSVLVWSTGNNQTSTAAVAAWLQDSGQFTSVTGLDQASALSLATLTSYDSVLYFSNSSDGQNPTAIGDVLADYADTGARLVLATFAWADQGGNTLGGRILSGNISPYQVADSSVYTSVSMSSNDGSGFFTGVNTLTGFFHDDVSLSSGAVSRGTWSDGRSLLATKGNVVGVNLFPDDSFGLVGGDSRRLFVNALITPTSVSPTTAVPEPSTVASLGLAALIGLVARSRRRAATPA